MERFRKCWNKFLESKFLLVLACLIALISLGEYIYYNSMFFRCLSEPATLENIQRLIGLQVYFENAEARFFWFSFIALLSILLRKVLAFAEKTA